MQWIFFQVVQNFVSRGTTLEACFKPAVVKIWSHLQIFGEISWSKKPIVYYQKCNDLWSKRHFQTTVFCWSKSLSKQFSVGQCGKFAWPTWTCYDLHGKISFTLMRNSKICGFLLKRLDFAHKKKLLNNSKCDLTFKQQTFARRTLLTNQIIIQEPTTAVL